MMELDGGFWKIIAIWFLYFVVYSVAGYLLEVSHITNPKRAFENRGYLFGPYCPIYGVGAVIIIAATQEVSRNPIFTFVMSAVVCTTLEYITSFLMEKIFNMRWWDYSSYPYNLNGRICLKNTLLFGIGGMVIVYVTQPTVGSLIAGLDDGLLIGAAAIMAVVMAVDWVFSTVASYRVKSFVNNLYNDSTTQIKKMAKDYYHQRKTYYKKQLKKLKQLH